MLKQVLRILDIDDPKISQTLTFWGIDIIVFMGDLSTFVSFAICNTTRNLEFPKCGYVQKTRIMDITALCGFTGL